MVEKKNNIQISVAICTYNRAKYLKYCIQSLFEQNHKMEAVQILIVDNNSTDNTKEVVSGFLIDAEN